MNKNLRFIYALIACLIFIYDSGFSQSDYRVVVSIVSEDRNEPVVGATIKIDNSCCEDFKTGTTHTETSDWEGRAYREFNKSGWFKVRVSHPDFEPVTAIVTELFCPAIKCDVPFNIVLKRRSSLKVVAINVVTQRDYIPVYDANVVLSAGGDRFYSGSTDANGNVIFNIEHGDTYELTISHRGYETIKKQLIIHGYKDQKEYPFTFSLIAKGDDFQRILRVNVKEKLNGELVPVEDAMVDASFESHSIKEGTNSEGFVEMHHGYAPGETMKIEVEKPGYKSATTSVLIKASGIGYGAQKDIASVVLQKLEGPKHTVHITVKDEQGFPVKFATLNFSDGSLKVTDAYGACDYVNSFGEGAEIRIDVEKKGWRPKSVSTLSGKPSLEIELEKDEATSYWEGTYTDANSTLTISGSGSGLSATFNYDVNGAKGSGSWSNCIVSGHKLTGNWTAQHEDDTKSGTRKGTLTVLLDGETLTGQYVEDTPAWSYKKGYSADNVYSSMRKGAVWQINLHKNK